jgi:hypothetical protein
MIAPRDRIGSAKHQLGESYPGKIAARRGNWRHENFQGACDKIVTRAALRPALLFFTGLERADW